MTSVWKCTWQSVSVTHNLNGKRDVGHDRLLNVSTEKTKIMDKLRGCQLGRVRAIQESSNCGQNALSANSKDISDVTSTVTQYSWLAKRDKNKEMTEFKRTSNDCRFPYMLDFILKPGRKLEYYVNASLSKFEGNSSIDTCRKSCWKFVCAQRI